MKKYSWIVALLLALSLAFAFVSCGDGGGGDKPVITPGVEAEDIDVVFGEGKVEVLPAGGGTVAYVDGGYTFTYGSGQNTGHGNARAYFKIDLGEASVKSFEKATFDFTAGGGDVLLESNNDGPKSLNLLASPSEADIKKYLSDAELIARIVNSVAPGAAGGGTINKGGVKVAPDGAKELAIEAGRPNSSLSGEVWFSVYLHSEPEGGSPSTKTSFTIKNFKLTALKGEAKDTVVNIPEIRGVSIPVAGRPATAAIAETTQYAGAITWNPAVNAEAGFILNTVYTATITLTAKAGYTFTGVGANFFEIFGATEEVSVSNPAGSGVITVVFPAAPAPPPGVKIEIGGVEQELDVTAFTGEAELLSGGTGFEYTYGDDAYDSAYAYFGPVNFGAGKTIYDYPKVTFTFKGIEGDIAYKQVYVYVSEEEFSDALNTANSIGNHNFAAGNTTAATGTVYYLGTASDQTQTAYVSITLRAAATGGTPAVATKYQISDIKFEEVTRGTITLAPDGGTVSSTSKSVILGAAVGDLPTPTKAGQDFIGWYDTSDALVTSATTVTTTLSGSTITAKWIGSATLAAVTINPSTASLAADGGTFANATTTSYAYTTGNYYGIVKFSFTVPTGAVLANYDKVTFTIAGSGSDFNYKNIRLLASTTLAGSDAGENSLKSVSGISSGNIGSAVEKVFVIDKAKAASLSGAIEVSIYVHAPSGNTYTISDVVFSQNE